MAITYKLFFIMCSPEAIHAKIRNTFFLDGLIMKKKKKSMMNV